MELHHVLILGDVCQTVTIILSLCAYIPHWIALLQTSSVEISVSAWVIWSISGLLSFIYALVQNMIHGVASMLFYSTLANCICLTVTLCLIFRHQIRRRLSPAPAQPIAQSRRYVPRKRPVNHYVRHRPADSYICEHSQAS